MGKVFSSKSVKVSKQYKKPPHSAKMGFPSAENVRICYSSATFAESFYA